MRFILAYFFILLSVESVKAFQPTLAFWQMGKNPIVTINSAGLGSTPSNDLNTRSLTMGGWGVLFYKAIVITSGTCTDAGVSATLTAAPSTLVALPFTFTPDPSTIDTYFTVCAIGQNYTGTWQSATQPTVSNTLRVNTILPVVTSLALNNGTDPTEVAAVPISYSATHSNLNITHFCLKTRLDSTAPASPAKTDSCWRAVNNPQPGQTPSQSISFSGFTYTLGFSTAEYFVFAWAKSESGAVSYLSSLGLGTNGTDKGSIQFNQSLPPTIINVLSANTDSPSSPVTKPELQVPAGSSVYIKWKLTDDKTLPATPVDISYTTDEVNFTSVVTGLANSAGTGCTVDGTTHTGCYRWVNGSPTSTYVKFRVTATDSNGLIAYFSAPPNNTTPFEIIAGNTDPGFNSSAQSAVIYPVGSIDSDVNATPGQMLVRDDGKVFIIDSRGLMTIDLSDGLYKLYLPYTGSYTDGPLASATLGYRPLRLAFDYNNGLLIYDHQRIRRVDFSTNTVSTLIGGGNSIANGTNALDFQISTNGNYGPLFQPLPNGDIWFATGSSTYVNQSVAKIFVYQASDGKIYQKVPTGTGSLEDAAFDPSSYAIYNWGIAFNPTTSAVTKIRSRSIIPVTGGHTPRSVSYNPSTMATTTPHIPFVGYWTEDGTITSPLGEMYAVERFQIHGLYKYNEGTNSWDRILGTGIKGQCPDGTAALSCDVHISDAYISSQNIIYFVDRNRIRTIDGDGNVLTLFGQQLSFGDGGQATSARMSVVNYIDRSNDGKIVFIDENEVVMREFAIGGNISKVAGNGREAAADTTNPAVSQPLFTKWYAGNMQFIINPSDGTIYYTRDGQRVSKLDRSTGIWSDIAGGGATDYPSADGLLGNQINLSFYQTGPNGFDGTSVMWHAYRWDGANTRDAMIKTYTVADGTQSSLLGVSGVIGGSDHIDNCVDGIAATSCAIQQNNSGAFSRSYWDASNSRWLMHANSSSKIRTVVPGGNIGTLVTLPRAIAGFTYVIKSTVPHLYYCATDGRMYKYNLNTSTETALYWPSSTIACRGQNVVWDSGRNSIIFPVTQNALSAIAEILDP